MAAAEGRVNCPQCNREALDIDVRCKHCGAALGSTGAHRMVGLMVLGTYELVDVLGQGGMSVVFKARHKLTDQEVALKILPPELAAHSQVKGRFLDEAKALAALDHPNIVHLYNFGQENGSFVLAMQFVLGKTWERLILENKRLDWKVSCRVAIDVLRALEYAHSRGVIHRDMKPSNVLVRAHDGSATVMDFGIAKMTTSTRLTATGQTMGTVRYMSPEQVRGQEVDLRTDLYSLGATLYESLVGDTPFDGETHFEIMTKHLSETPKPPSTLGVVMPSSVEDVLMRSLAKKVSQRFESARDMRKLLEAALRDADVSLGDTQPIDGNIVADIRAASLGLSASPGDARPTAGDDTAVPDRGAAELQTVRPARSLRWTLIAGVLILLAGGAVGTGWWLAQRHAGYAAKTSIKNVELVDGKRFDDVHVLVETDGKVTVDVVAAAYRKSLEDLRELDPSLDARLEVIDVIVAVPQAVMCAPGAYPVAQPPDDCKIALAASAIGVHAEKRLYVVDDPAELARAMHTGLAKAECDFQDVSAEKLARICDLKGKLGAN
jgi:serine/threonine protein kinase